MPSSWPRSTSECCSKWCFCGRGRMQSFGAIKWHHGVENTSRVSCSYISGFLGWAWITTCPDWSSWITARSTTSRPPTSPRLCYPYPSEIRRHPRVWGGCWSTITRETIWFPFSWNYGGSSHSLWSWTVWFWRWASTFKYCEQNGLW